MATADGNPLQARIALMRISVIGRLRRIVGPRVVPDAVLAARTSAGRGVAAPLPRSADSDGKLRRLRQLVEDNRLL